MDPVKHLRPKAQNAFNSGGSNSLNWRDINKNVNESNNYGYNNHYLTSAFCMLIGLPVKIQKTDGSIYEGILETVSNKLEFHLNHVSLQTDNSNTTSTNGDIVEKAIFPFRDIVYCKAAEVDLDYAKRDQLLTDSAITGFNGAINERELIQWKPEDDALGVSGGLDDIDTNGSWSYDDMVRVNEERHGLKSTFDSSMSNYMTPLEKRDDDEFKEQERRAEQVAREMQQDSRHKEHENVDSGIGEEELFSAVSRATSNASNNNNNNSSSNDGFTTYTKPFRGRGGKGGNNTNTVAPRFQKNNRNQDAVTNANFNNHQTSHRNNIPPRAQNGSMSRIYPHQQSQGSGPIFNSASKSNTSFPPQQTQAEFPCNNPPVKQVTLSYSAVAMKKQQPVASVRAGNGPKPFVPSQQMNEQLAAAKADLIQNAKHQVATARNNAGSVPSTQGQHTAQANIAATTSVSKAGQAIISHVYDAPNAVETTLAQRIMDKPHTTCNPPEQKEVLPKEAKVWSKFGREFSEEEEKKPNMTKEDLKDFSKGFKLVDSKPKSSSTKKVPHGKIGEGDAKLKQGETKGAVPVSEVLKKVESNLTESKLTASQTLVTSSSTSTKATAGVTTTSSSASRAAISSSATVTAQITATVSSSSSSSTTQTKLTLNPTAKAFTPTGPKSTATKQLSYPGENYPAAGAPHYHPVHASQMISAQHHPEVMQQTHVQQVVKNVYGPRFANAAVYSIPGDYAGASAGNAQVHPGQTQAGYVNQNVPNQPQLVLVHNPNGGMQYQAIMPQSQQFIPMQVPQQQGMIRYGIPQQANRLASNMHQEGMQNNYVIAVSQQQHGGVLPPHQAVTSNQHHNFSTPSPSPHMQQQQYVVNPHNYPQITSPITQTQGAVTYRPTSAIHSAGNQHHQQQSFVMMASHGPHGVAMQPGQQYIQGQPHAGMMANYQPGS